MKLFNYSILQSCNTRNAFTLIELVISVTLFIILVSIAAGGFVHILRNQRVTAALMSMNDSMAITTERMSREIRTGVLFCTANAPSAITPPPKDMGCESLIWTSSSDSTDIKELTFMNDKNKQVWYRFNEAAGTLERREENGSSLYFPITAENAAVTAFDLVLCGRNIDDSRLGNCDPSGVPSSDYPPRITIFMAVTSKEPDIARFNLDPLPIQTTVSARVF